MPPKSSKKEQREVAAKRALGEQLTTETSVDETFQRAKDEMMLGTETLSSLPPANPPNAKTPRTNITATTQYRVQGSSAG